MKCMYVCARMYVRTYVCVCVYIYQKVKITYLTLILDSYEYIAVAYETMYCIIWP